jgi:hypothetical protein
MPLIGTEHNNRATETAIEKAFKAVARKGERYQFDYEHGQWWVTELGTGAMWGVYDTHPGEFSFEVVARGDREDLF